MGELSDRELDAQIAEKVMGEPEPLPPPDCDDPISITWIGLAWLHTHEYERGDVCEIEPAPYSTRIEFAFHVVNKLGLFDHKTSGDLDVTWTLAKNTSNEWVIRKRHGIDIARNKSLPRLICEAALQAVSTTEE